MRWYINSKNCGFDKELIEFLILMEIQKLYFQVRETFICVQNQNGDVHRNYSEKSSSTSASGQ